MVRRWFLRTAKGSDGWDSTATSCAGSVAMARAKPPVKHMPTAPTPGPPQRSCSCTASARSQSTTGDVRPVANATNSRLTHAGTITCDSRPAAACSRPSASGSWPGTPKRWGMHRRAADVGHASGEGGDLGGDARHLGHDDDRRPGAPAGRCRRVLAGVGERVDLEAGEGVVGGGGVRHGRQCLPFGPAGSQRVRSGPMLAHALAGRRVRGVERLRVGDPHRQRPRATTRPTSPWRWRCPCRCWCRRSATGVVLVRARHRALDRARGAAVDGLRRMDGAGVAGSGRRDRAVRPRGRVQGRARGARGHLHRPWRRRPCGWPARARPGGRPGVSLAVGAGR